MAGGRKRAKIRKVLRAWGRGIKRLAIRRIDWRRPIHAPAVAMPGTEAPDGTTRAAPERRLSGVPFKRLYTEDALRSRRQWTTDTTGADLRGLAGDAIPPAEMLKGNIESHIGYVQVPIGVGGPLLVHGEHAQGVFFVPLATTEGALVASCTRGMRAVTESGGANVRVVSDQMMRAPMFTFESLTEAVRFVEWIKERDAQLKSIANSQSRVGRLLDVHPVILGDTVCLQLSYFTGDAYGAVNEVVEVAVLIMVPLAAGAYRGFP
jgi:hydroxymethylglutaryl-CoA reductase